MGQGTGSSSLFSSVGKWNQVRRELLGKGSCCVGKRLIAARRPEVEHIALHLALGVEAAEHPPVEIDRKRSMSSAVVLWLVNRAGAALLRSESAALLEDSESLQNIPHRDSLSERGKVDPRGLTDN